MAWFDGTTDIERCDFEKKFPIAVTENLRTNTEKTKIAVVNDFTEGTKLYKFPTLIWNTVCMKA